MANLLIPIEERNLTPDEVEALDKRRHTGLVFQIIAGQFSIIAILLTVWAGQDLTYSPGFEHPMALYMILLFVLAIIFGVTGTSMRRGSHSF